MSVTRKWYTFNCAPGGQHSSQNYFLSQTFPSICGQLPCGSNVCAVLGIYSEVLGGGSSITYGTNPKTFTADPNLDSYITQAFGSGCYYPNVGQPYVYMKHC